MDDDLTIKANEQEITITSNRSDYAAALARGIIGAAPFVGPIIGEALSARIPNQKLDRVIIFTKVLEDKVKYLEEDLVRTRFKTEEFEDLLEDALLQASKALTEERREYIATLITRGLSNEQLTHVEQKKLLSLLDQLNDVEIIMLYFEALDNGPEKDELMNKYHFFWVSGGVKNFV